MIDRGAGWKTGVRPKLWWWIFSKFIPADDAMNMSLGAGFRFTIIRSVATAILRRRLFAGELPLMSLNPSDVE